MAISLVAFMIFYFVDPMVTIYISRWVFYLCIFFLILTLVIGETTRGSIRWLNFGPVGLQFSEFIKPFFALYLAEIASTWNLNHLIHLIKFCLLSLVPVGLVFVQPDLGTSLVLIAIVASVLVSSNLKNHILFFVILLSAAIAIFGISHLRPYQKTRLSSFLQPYTDPSGSGYNLIQSTISVGSGKITGWGVRQGSQSQLKFLPERHTDFAFAAFSEEFGFLGTITVLGCYFYIVLFFYRASLRHSQFIERTFLASFAMTFAFNILLNVGMNIGISPVVGITLPLFSYGGSSLVSTMIFMGICLSMAKKNTHPSV